MRTARTDRGKPEVARDRYRRRLLSHRPVTKLAMGIAAPAIRRAVSGHAAAVGAPRTDRREAQPTGDRHGTRAGGVRPIAQLARSVGAPTVCRPARGHTASLMAPRADRREAESTRDGRSRAGELEDKAAGAEGTTRAVAPTVRRAAGGHRTGVWTRCTDGRKGEATQHCSRGVPRPGHSSVAPLTVAAKAPTVPGAGRRYPAHCRTATRTGGREQQPPRHRHRAGPGQGLPRIRIEPPFPAPKGTPSVVAPAVLRAVRRHTTTLAGPGIHQRERHLHGERAAGRPGAPGRRDRQRVAAP